MSTAEDTRGLPRVPETETAPTIRGVTIMQSTRKSPESIGVNTHLLGIFNNEKQHHEVAMMTIMLVFVTASGALFTAIELLTKRLGATPLSLLGITSVIISAVSVWKARREWKKAMHDGFEVQKGLGEMGVHLYAKPFGTSPAKEGVGVTDLVHLTVLIFWVWYLFYCAGFDYHRVLQIFGN